MDQGVNAIKLKVGGISGGFSVEDDYNRVKAVRQALGPDDQAHARCESRLGCADRHPRLEQNVRPRYCVGLKSRSTGMTTSSR